MTEQTIVGAPSGKNHILSKNPMTTLCGQHRPKGWAPSHPDGAMCIRCSEQTSYNSVTNRPLPDKLKGTRS